MCCPFLVGWDSLSWLHSWHNQPIFKICRTWGQLEYMLAEQSSESPIHPRPHLRQVAKRKANQTNFGWTILLWQRNCIYSLSSSTCPAWLQKQNLVIANGYIANPCNEIARMFWKPSVSIWRPSKFFFFFFIYSGIDLQLFHDTTTRKNPEARNLPLFRYVGYRFLFFCCWFIAFKMLSFNKKQKTNVCSIFIWR